MNVALRRSPTGRRVTKEPAQCRASDMEAQFHTARRNLGITLNRANIIGKAEAVLRQHFGDFVPGQGLVLEMFTSFVFRKAVDQSRAMLRFRPFRASRFEERDLHRFGSFLLQPLRPPRVLNRMYDRRAFPLDELATVQRFKAAQAEILQIFRSDENVCATSRDVQAFVSANEPTEFNVYVPFYWQRPAVK